MNIKEQLQFIRQNTQFSNTHIKYLYKLKKNGFEPKVIYDIGCCVLQWTDIVKKIWPKAKIILFDTFTSSEFLYKDYDYFLGILSNKNNMIVPFFQNNIQSTNNSKYFYNNSPCFLQKTYKLDTIVKNKKFPLPDLVKIDVQEGWEKNIIEGGKKTISNTTHLIVELQNEEYNLNPPIAKKTIPFIKNLGFKCITPIFSNNNLDKDYRFVNIFR